MTVASVASGATTSKPENPDLSALSGATATKSPYPRVLAERQEGDQAAAIIAAIRAAMPALARAHGVARAAVFGSTARGDRRETSDVDILVEFQGGATADKYFGLQFALEDMFGLPIDLVTTNALRREFRESVDAEKVDVWT